MNDWFDSVRSLNRFSDGGKITTNWVAHPMMGSVATHILGQNDPETWRTRSVPATLLAGERQAVPLCHRLFDTIRDRAAVGILSREHTPGRDRLRPHVQPGNAVVGGRGPDSATRPSADACDASEVGQYPDSSPEPNQGFCQRARLQAPLGLRRGELLLSKTHHAARPGVRYSVFRHAVYDVRRRRKFGRRD